MEERDNERKKQRSELVEAMSVLLTPLASNRISRSTPRALSGEREGYDSEH